MQDDDSYIWVWAYRKGSGIIPTFTGVYGAEQFMFRIDGKFSSYFTIDIRRSEINALDKQSQRCDLSDDAVSLCVERFVEKHLNCSLKRLFSNSKLGTCNKTKWDTSVFGTSKLSELMMKIGKLDEREIFEATGCMPGCSKSKFELLTIFQDRIYDGSKVAELSFLYPTGEYDLWEEYHIYNWGSFIPDVGGYLGLLLGCSVLSLYHMITPWLMTQIRRLFKWIETIWKR